MQILKKEKTDLLRKEIESVISNFESDNEGWNILTMVVGRDFDCHFAIDMNVIEKRKNLDSFLSNLTEEQNRKIVETLLIKLSNNSNTEEAVSVLNLFLQYDDNIEKTGSIDDFVVDIRGVTTIH